MHGGNSKVPNKVTVMDGSEDMDVVVGSDGGDHSDIVNHPDGKVP